MAEKKNNGNKKPRGRDKKAIPQGNGFPRESLPWRFTLEESNNYSPPSVDREHARQEALPRPPQKPSQAQGSAERPGVPPPRTPAVPCYPPVRPMRPVRPVRRALPFTLAQGRAERPWVPPPRTPAVACYPPAQGSAKRPMVPPPRSPAVACYQVVTPVKRVLPLILRRIPQSPYKVPPPRAPADAGCQTERQVRLVQPLILRRTPHGSYKVAFK